MIIMNYLSLIFGLIIIKIKISKAQNSTNCITPNNQPGLCIELHRCADFYNRVLSKRLPEQNSLLSLSICDYSNGNIMYCCAVGSIIPTTTSGIIMHGDTRTCGCGVIEPSYGLKETKLGEFPWTALIEYTSSGNKKGYDCEGSLINNKYVITAGHCFTARSPNCSLTGVRLGEWDKSTSRDCIIDSGGHQECADSHIDVPVEKIIVHEKYNWEGMIPYNDIALLRLARQIQFTDWISPICLPTTNSLKTATFDRFAFHISGWGVPPNTTTHIKTKTMVIVSSLSTCKSIYSKFRIVLRDHQMCAGGVKGVDLCRGDSGTPLIGLDTKTKLRNNYFLAGIYSFGTTPCESEEYPHVYTRVGLYVDWIWENIQP